MKPVRGYKSLLSPQPSPWNEATLHQKKEIATKHIKLFLWVYIKTHDTISN